MHSLTSAAICFLSFSALSLAKPINPRQLDSEYKEGQGRRLLGSSFGAPGEFVPTEIFPFLGVKADFAG
jgi:hypothetical protein